MSDRFFFPMAALAAVLMIALAAVWPQGLGARSLGPFGHTPYAETPAGRAARARQAAARKQIGSATPAAAVAAGLRPDQ